MATIEVRPQKNGRWSVGGEKFDDRRSALAHAREIRESSDNVVLLRPDGSLYGEVVAAEQDGTAQNVDATPAGENGSV